MMHSKPQISFITACRTGNLEAVKILLSDPDVNPQYCNNEPLEAALINRHFDIVKLLLNDKRVLSDTLNLTRICIKSMCFTLESLEVIE